MRYFLIGFLALILSLPAVAGTAGNNSQSTKGATKYALFSGKHAKKAKKSKKAPKQKKTKKARKHSQATPSK